MRERTFRNNPTAKYGDIKEAQARYGIGKDKVREIAKAAGAILKIGRATRFNFGRMDAYLEAACDAFTSIVGGDHDTH